MQDLWRLPTALTVGGQEYGIHADFRDILEIFSYFQDPDTPEFIRWQIALRLFYERPIPMEHQMEAMEKLTEFINYGQPQTAGPTLLNWQKDADMIIADVNKAAGQEVRAVKFVHWWTFLSWFHSIGEGQLSTVIGIREKLHRGKALEAWEKDYYRKNKSRIDLPKTYSAQEKAERDRLNQMLGN